MAPECIQAFNELKLGKSTKWIIFKISDDWKEIVVEETSTDPDYSKFREKLVNAQSKSKRGESAPLGVGGRYAVFDVEYEAEGGEGKRSKITFISWVPDDAPQYVSPDMESKRLDRANTQMLATHDVLFLQGCSQACTERSCCRYPSQRRRRHRTRQRCIQSLEGTLSHSKSDLTLDQAAKKKGTFKKAHRHAERSRTSKLLHLDDAWNSSSIPGRCSVLLGATA